MIKEKLGQYFSEALHMMDSICKASGIPIYLIGANATSLQLIEKGHYPPRGTKDIDFAIAVASHDEYKIVSDALQNYGYSIAYEPFTFYNREKNIALDIMPFGAIAMEGKVRFRERESEVVVLGFEEVLANSTTLHLEGTTVHTPTLPGMVLLKLLAFADRPEVRGKDPEDILYILERYWEAFSDEIYAQHLDAVLLEDSLQHHYTLLVAARAIGEELAAFSADNPALRQRLIYALNMADRSLNRVALGLAKGRYTYDEMLEVVKRLGHGLGE